MSILQKLVIKKNVPESDNLTLATVCLHIAVLSMTVWLDQMAVL